MKYWSVWSLLAVLALSAWVVAVVQQSDNTAVAVPTNNGTSSNTTVTGRMQMYVGFYGNLTLQVRNNTATGNVLYQKNVQYGKLYFFKAGVTPTAPYTAAPTTGSNTNGNFSLTGFYNTSYHFDTQDTVCGIASTNKLNTTDNRMTGIYYDSLSAGAPNYFFCTDIGAFTSTNGFGTIGYEIIVAKTPTYTSYDIWFDLQ